jgi:hypothetical protein
MPLLPPICCFCEAPTWQVDGSAVSSEITQWFESRGTRNHTLLSHLRLPQTWRVRFLHLYPPEQGGPVSHFTASLEVAILSLWGALSDERSLSIAIVCTSKLFYDWQTVCLGVEPTLRLVTWYYFLSEGWCQSRSLVSMGCPLWREDGSAICSAITQWSKSCRTRNHTLLSHLKLPQPGGPSSCSYIPQE